MKKPTLLIMAAGLGSRFGGLKQLAAIGPGGQYLLEYSVYDAARAGFGDVVAVITRAIEEEFERGVGKRLQKILPLRTVYQEMADLPPGFSVPPERKKPWGTTHAVLAARAVIENPFAVINGDDFYGEDAYRRMAAFLSELSPQDAGHCAMAGYRLENTLSEHGSVSRGVCRAEGDALLEIAERTRIERRGDGIAYSEDAGETWLSLAPDTIVSMNFWGFSPAIFPLFMKELRRFLQNIPDSERSEIYLPYTVGELMKCREAAVRVLNTDARWCGVTYAADLPGVQADVREMTERGLYPAEFS